MNCAMSASPRLPSTALICFTASSKPSSPNCSCSMSSNLSYSLFTMWANGKLVANIKLGFVLTRDTSAG